MLDRLLDIISLLGHWGYLIIFLAAFLESAAFMGFLVPGETIVVLSGFLSFQGYLKLGDCISIIILGAVLGDTVGYRIGKAIGRDYFERHGRLLFLKEKHIKKADEYFEKHGGKTVFLGRFTSFLRAIAPFAAGMSKMPYGRFLIYNISGGILWAMTFTLLGYFFGQSWELVEKWSGRAGLFIFFIILIIFGFAYLYRKIIGRQKEFYEWIRSGYAAIVSAPLVRGFIERHPRFVLFITERLSPKSYLGLHLTVGLTLSVVFAWVFGGITEDVLTGDPLVEVDHWVLNNILRFRTPAVTSSMIIISRLGSGPVITAVSIVVAAYFLFRKRFLYLATYISAILGGNILQLALKLAVHRGRPISVSSLISAEGFSFPSGHAMMSVIFCGMIVYFIIRKMHSWRLGVFMVMAAGFIIFLIGLSRIYLQVHYLSDILAGYAVGLFWLSICLTALEIYRKKNRTSL